MQMLCCCYFTARRYHFFSFSKGNIKSFSETDCNIRQYNRFPPPPNGKERMWALSHSSVLLGLGGMTLGESTAFIATIAHTIPHDNATRRTARTVVVCTVHLFRQATQATPEALQLPTSHCHCGQQFLIIEQFLLGISNVAPGMAMAARERVVLLGVSVLHNCNSFIPPIFLALNI